MGIESVRTVFMSIFALCLGVMTSLIAFVTPMKEEGALLMKKPTPTPLLQEKMLELTKEEASTMSASFIKEFETFIASRGGERR